MLTRLGVLMVLLSAACQSTNGSEPAASPTELIEQLQGADQSRQYGAMVALVAPQDREIFVFGMWFDAAYSAIGASPGVVERYRSLEAKHGLDESWLNVKAKDTPALRLMAMEALKGKSLAPLFQDLTTFCRDQQRSSGRELGFSGEVHSVEVLGDRATAQIGTATYKFIRQNDAWYFSFAEQSDGGE